MNIIKFKDEIIAGDLIFNTFFKGKYAYAINWKHAVPIGDDGLTDEEYIRWSQIDNIMDEDMSSDWSSDLCVNDFSSKDYSDDSADTSSTECHCPCCDEDTSSDITEERFKIVFKDFINGYADVLDYSANYAGAAFTFDVHVDQGYKLYKVMVNGEKLESNCNVFTFEVKEDSVIAVYIIRDTLLDLPVIDIESYFMYIDNEKTDKTNDTNKYLYLNKYAVDDDITEDEIRCFRTWLAKSMLDLTPGMTDMQKVMLEFYANEMNDSTCIAISNLSKFKPTQYKGGSSFTASCGCQTETGLSHNSFLQLFGNGVCDPLIEYKAMLHGQMVDMFTNIDTWKQYDEFLLDIIKYLKSILKINFPLYSLTSISSSFVECGKLNEKELGQKNGVSILTSLIEAFQYIYNDEQDKHKNFITQTLYNWSDNLYELMRW